MIKNQKEYNHIASSNMPILIYCISLTLNVLWDSPVEEITISKYIILSRIKIGHSDFSGTLIQSGSKRIGEKI